ncbi:AI-2E family transporter [Rouxiella badensis]|jgi:predicted PurR-regulated permease PerM|uniref:AI-2E family transporter n=1 Tax=Rouxiella badensis TaxID=1646377 RepID=A0A1X0WFV6_9GAMM|nr:AI-2E family transporter [Rouxiella badensis]MCC3704435.1 AI-2E family transporter [Rouxiella badensis]MCC3718528.1 AI-2E family transporter [Rouxiella badensis]MCC3726704.1 AI-2E family transporter [Rouxiella badensis]MCC3735348.1 AI-2E family transporter [Rouxiella badensis]MCC3738946.1 AI-2E family transporter [Rouxiella badensis]
MQILRPHHIRWLSLLVIMGGLLLILPLHLLGCFISGFIVYELVNALTPYFQKIIRGERARWLVVALISTIVVSALILAVMGIVTFLLHDVRNPAAFNNKISQLLNDAQSRLSPVMLHYLPANLEELQREFIQWMREHVVMLQTAGKNAAHTFLTMLVGMILGAIISLQRQGSDDQRAPLKSDLMQRMRLLSQSFRNVVFAQFQISLINTVLSAVFLFGIMPLFGIHLPLSKTLVVFTFVCGLLPVVGNLISNTVICIVGLSISLWVGAMVLAYLIIIHKIEYFLNARIVGTSINAKSWEVLLAMLIFESAFGLPGVVAAPIYYAYLKSELKAARLI